MKKTMLIRPCARPSRRRGERGVALVIAILTLFILTLLGIGLLFTTTTEMQIAGAEGVVNKTFYAADSGTQYGIQQGKLGLTVGPTVTGCTTNYWCFNVAEQNTGTTGRNLAVTVSPFQLVNFQLSPGTQLNVGATPLYNVTYNFTSFASEGTPLNSQKTINVDVQVGPVPFSIPNK
jgi:Tfp pilus assembly protein PilX